jgi:hypothetical protein
MLAEFISSSCRCDYVEYKHNCLNSFNVNSSFWCLQLHSLEPCCYISCILYASCCRFDKFNIDLFINLYYLVYSELSTVYVSLCVPVINDWPRSFCLVWTLLSYNFSCPLTYSKTNSIIPSEWQVKNKCNVRIFSENLTQNARYYRGYI